LAASLRGYRRAVTADDQRNRGLSADEVEDEKAVRSIPLDTEDGGTVVIEQQNVGPANQLGGGEFKNVYGQKSPDQAEAEQERLEEDAPLPPGED
jgi:hypothetical protein